MNWVSTLVRVVGAAFPGASSLVQLQSELDSNKLQERLRALEDPVSALHADIRSLSALLYESLASGGNKILVSEEMVLRYSRPLHILDAEQLIDVTHVIGRPFPEWFWITNSSYILYMAALFEDQHKMDRLVQMIDQAPAGRWLGGGEIAEEIDVPLPVIRAVFQLYERRGLGILSREIGTANYYVKT